MGSRLLEETNPTPSPIIERLEREIDRLHAQLATERAETWALRRYVDRLLGQDKQGASVPKPCSDQLVAESNNRP